MAEWKPCRVNIDYHVEVDRNLYSVPYQLVHAQVEARFTQTTVESSSTAEGSPPTSAHGPGPVCDAARAHAARHRAHAEWTPSRLIAWAEKTGPATGRVVAGILEAGLIPSRATARASASCGSALHGADRLEAACERAERLRSYRFRTVEQILLGQQDRLPLDDPAPHAGAARTRICAARLLRGGLC